MVLEVAGWLYYAVVITLFKLNYAEPNDWSRPLATGRPNEAMAILTCRVRVD
ncbi:hypothetical protein N836_24215 [Leptolyngbya sp. Heron Island J]|uniref:hypothetical protein n=1 Tax=Leptolyngbya sp. Heron Island J TaxID=1385935 RepID=UPI0003B98E68|nr:hypothetical protein [Leptolyngbya sp. Heron Island J]ESA32790.1 hypothetical protein N836_24215 [Leptolyngbya sp. Heron Island J]